jgi:hypothetical protein
VAKNMIPFPKTVRAFIFLTAILFAVFMFEYIISDSPREPSLKDLIVVLVANALTTLITMISINQKYKTIKGSNRIETTLNFLEIVAVTLAASYLFVNIIGEYFAGYYQYMAVMIAFFVSQKYVYALFGRKYAVVVVITAIVFAFVAPPS